MNRVVITGIGAISPVGNTANDMWDSLLQGKCGIDYITKFDTTEHKVKIAAEVKHFDPTIFLSKREIRKTDLYCQYAIAAADQAMQDSGILGKVNPDRLGVYVGSGIGGMTTFIDQCKLLYQEGPKKVSPFFIPMMIANIAAGTIAIRNHAQGPCLPVVTACATSSHAIGEAYRAIKFGYADAIIAGGSEAAINPLSIAGFTNCMALTSCNDISRASIPFDLRRSGFVIGEGSGMLILEDYEHACSRGAKIYAEICGYANTCDAYHVTAPHPEAAGAEKAISLAVEEASVSDHDIIYLNAHGTSTPANDRAETIAIKQVFQEKAYDILISSTKSMTGHMLGAAGAIEAIVSILSMRDSIIPPTIGYQEKDPECDLNYVPNHSFRSRIDLALSTSLGFGGHNACLAFRKV